MVRNQNCLVYELFSGVGFCNQLFSLETAIYLANISNRRLILLIRHPLCHIGHANWEFGEIMNFFDVKYKEHLKNGIEIFYGNKALLELENIQKQRLKVINLGNFSGIVFVDEKEKSKMNSDYLSFRKEHILDFSKLRDKYIMFTRSNASRCFYNFYTSEENYITMSKICESLTILAPHIRNICQQIKLPNKYISIHFRFGDLKHSPKDIEGYFTGKFQSLMDQLILFNPDRSLPIYIMADRKDTQFFKRLSNENFKYIFTDDITKRYKSPLKRDNVFHFLIEKYICEQSDIFIGSEGSTVSNQIQYVRHLEGKACNLYVNKEVLYRPNKCSWKLNNTGATGIGWKLYFRDNVYDHFSKTNMITLTNDGYIHYTQNLLVSMKRLGIETIITIYCLGGKSYNFFKSEYPRNKVISLDCDESVKVYTEYRAIQNKDIIGKRKWAKLTSYKFAAINKELRRGNDVIFVDGDIVFEKDPIPILKNLVKTNPNTELFVQNDSPKETDRKCMCTGFFWLKSNPNSISITDFKTINKDLDEFQNDQQYLRKFSSRIRHDYLDLSVFPNGKHYRDSKPKNPYIIHFNYDVGIQKLQRMKNYKKWYLKQDTPERIRPFISEKYKCSPIQNRNQISNQNRKETSGQNIDVTDANKSLKDSIMCNVKLDELFKKTVARCSWIEMYYGIFSQQIIESGYRTAVEVGVGYGTHCKHILDNTHIDCLYMVDPFVEYNDLFSKDVERLGGYNTLMKNIHIMLENNCNRYRVIQKKSLCVTEEDIPSGSIDIVFLDGDHSYESVSEDLPFWYDKLSKGGILMGNDYSRKSSGTKRSVDNFVKENNLIIEFIDRKNYPIYKITKH